MKTNTNKLHKLPWRFEFTSTEHDIPMICIQLCKDSPWWLTWPKGEPLLSSFPTWNYTEVAEKLYSGEWKIVEKTWLQKVNDWWVK